MILKNIIGVGLIFTISLILFLIVLSNKITKTLLLSMSAIFFLGFYIAIILGLDFLGLFYIMVYVGAIAIMFLFAIMVIDMRFLPLEIYSSGLVKQFTDMSDNTLLLGESRSSSKRKFVICLIIVATAVAVFAILNIYFRDWAVFISLGDVFFGSNIDTVLPGLEKSSGKMDIKEISKAFFWSQSLNLMIAAIFLFVATIVSLAVCLEIKSRMTLKK